MNGTTQFRRLVNAEADRVAHIILSLTEQCVRDMDLVIGDTPITIDEARELRASFHDVCAKALADCAKIIRETR